MQVITERDVLGTQLIRRNDELALLYEKVKIMESTLKKGEAQYLDRVQVRPLLCPCSSVSLRRSPSLHVLLYCCLVLYVRMNQCRERRVPLCLSLAPSLCRTSEY